MAGMRNLFAGSDAGGERAAGQSMAEKWNSNSVRTRRRKRSGAYWLTDVAVRKAKEGTHADGRGLYLEVKPSGTKSWILRYQLEGRRREMGLGPYPTVDLAGARRRAEAQRALLIDGIDPLKAAAAARAARVRKTFREAAKALIEAKRAGWRNTKHAAQWTATLETYAYPVIGDSDVEDVDTAAVLRVLNPIWTAKPETATRVRQRIEAVLDSARALGYRKGENPARWRGHLDHLLPKPTAVRSQQHFPALPWRDAAAFMRELRDSRAWGHGRWSSPF